MYNRKFAGIILASMLSLMLVFSGTAMAGKDCAGKKDAACQKSCTQKAPDKAGCDQACGSKDKCTADCKGHANCTTPCPQNAACDKHADGKPGCPQAAGKDGKPCCPSGDKSAKKGDS